MSILFSGDFHSNAVNELSCITKNTLIRKYTEEKYNKIKYQIILGDAAFLWPGQMKNDIYNFRALGMRPFPVLSVIGNHEPVLGMKGLPEVDIGIGEKVIEIWEKPFTAYLKRGKVYTIDGIKFLVLGGALSIDQYRRIPNQSWWENEYWSEEEKESIFRLLEMDNTFDYVISHTGPHHINYRLFRRTGNFIDKFSDDVALLNDKIHEKIEFREWWCGHWHINQYYYDRYSKKAYQYLYKSTKILEKIGSKFKVHNEYGIKERNFLK